MSALKEVNAILKTDQSTLRQMYRGKDDEIDKLKETIMSVEGDLEAWIHEHSACEINGDTKGIARVRRLGRIRKIITDPKEE